MAKDGEVSKLLETLRSIQRQELSVKFQMALDATGLEQNDLGFLRPKKGADLSKIPIVYQDLRLQQLNFLFQQQQAHARGKFRTPHAFGRQQKFYRVAILELAEELLREGAPRVVQFIHDIVVKDGLLRQKWQQLTEKLRRERQSISDKTKENSMSSEKRVVDTDVQKDAPRIEIPSDLITHIEEVESGGTKKLHVTCSKPDSVVKELKKVRDRCTTHSDAVDSKLIASIADVMVNATKNLRILEVPNSNDNAGGVSLVNAAIAFGKGDTHSAITYLIKGLALKHGQDIGMRCAESCDKVLKKVAEARATTTDTPSEICDKSQKADDKIRRRPAAEKTGTLPTSAVLPMTAMPAPPVHSPGNIGNHTYTSHGKVWQVASLWKEAEHLPVYEVPISLLHVDERIWTAEARSPQGIIKHLNAIENADLDYPIILSSSGHVMDGYHRIAKALMLGYNTIKAVQFRSDPNPARYEKD